MSGQDFFDSEENRLKEYGTAQQVTNLEKSLSSKNVTIADWNTLVQYCEVTLSDVRRLYDLLRAAFPNISSAITRTSSGVKTWAEGKFTDVEGDITEASNTLKDWAEGEFTLVNEALDTKLSKIALPQGFASGVYTQDSASCSLTRLSTEVVDGVRTIPLRDSDGTFNILTPDNPETQKAANVGYVKNRIGEAVERIKLAYEAATGILTLSRGEDDADVIDLPLELIVEEGHYDKESKDLVLTLANKDIIEIPLDDVTQHFVDYVEDIRTSIHTLQIAPPIEALSSARLLTTPTIAQLANLKEVI